MAAPPEPDEREKEDRHHHRRPRAPVLEEQVVAGDFHQHECAVKVEADFGVRRLVLESPEYTVVMEIYGIFQSDPEGGVDSFFACLRQGGVDAADRPDGGDV